MKLNQFINFQCDGCGKVKTFSERTTYDLLNREGRVLRREMSLSFSNGSPIRICLELLLRWGWVVTSLRDVNDRFSAFGKKDELPGQIRRERLSLVCGGCASDWVPPRSSAAEAAIAQMDGGLRAEVLRLRAEVAELRAATSEAVAS